MEDKLTASAETQSVGSPAMDYVSPGDSSAAMMRTVAAALAGEWMEPEPWPPHLVALTGPANRLPPKMRLRLLDRCIRDVGVSPEMAGEINAADMAKWATELYEGHTAATYDTIVIGAPSGGAAHLAALLGVPFLSEHFLTRFRYRGVADDISGYHTFGSQLALTILKRNPDLAVINHYDPLHDRFLVPYVNYLRMKLLDLSGPYADFIRCRLRPGGTLLFVDCQYSWGQYRIGKRHYFQVGGLGGVSDEQYVKGSGDIQRFLAEQGHSNAVGWTLPYPWLREPESEWGTLPAFRQAVDVFAAEHGYRVRTLRGGHPEDFARVAFYASYQAMLNAGREPAGVLVDSFTQCSPTAALKGGLLPLWLPYNCRDSLDFLRQLAPHFPKSKPVLLCPAPNYSPTWDVARAEEWAAACGEGAQVEWIGADPAAYPVDLAALFRFVPDLQAWCAGHQNYPRPPFTINDLEALISSMAAQTAAGG